MKNVTAPIHNSSLEIDAACPWLVDAFKYIGNGPFIGNNLCPRCHDRPRHGKLGYCKPCKVLVNQEISKRRAAELRKERDARLPFDLRPIPPEINLKWAIESRGAQALRNEWLLLRRNRPKVQLQSASGTNMASALNGAL